MRTCRPWVILLILFYATAAGAGEAPANRRSKIDFSGNLKSYFFVIEPVKIGNAPTEKDSETEGLAQNKLRLRLLAPLSDSVKAEVAYEVRPTVADSVPALTAGSLSGQQVTSAYRVDDFQSQMYPDDRENTDNFNITQNLDRFCLTLSPGFADFTIGRQPIAFGAAHVINPTDVLAPYNFNELDTENRIGVDALRVRVPVGAMGEVDSGLVFGQDARRKTSAAFVRLRQPFRATDFTLSAIDFRDNFLLGLDAVRSVGGAGVWFEGAWTWAGLFEERASGDDYFRGSAGLDYNFNWHDGIYVYLEYHYNGASGNDPEKYIRQTGDTAYRDGAVYLLGRHYLATGVSFQITPLWTASLSVLANMGDASGYFMGALQYNFSENAYLSFGVSLPRGDRAMLESIPGQSDVAIRPESEFGLYPTLYYTSISFYF